MSNAYFQHCTPSKMDRATFVSTFGDIYEHSSWIAADTFDQGIDNSHNEIKALQKKMASILLNADKQAKLKLINAHPDLAGKAATSGQLTESSTSEQASAGISDCTPTEFARFNELNNGFKEKFGFPFIMAVKGSNRQLILASFEERIHSAPEQEFLRALQEINKISQFRLAVM